MATLRAALKEISMLTTSRRESCRGGGVGQASRPARQAVGPAGLQSRGLLHCLESVLERLSALAPRRNSARGVRGFHEAFADGGMSNSAAIS